VKAQLFYTSSQNISFIVDQKLANNVSPLLQNKAISMLQTIQARLTFLLRFAKGFELAQEFFKAIKNENSVGKIARIKVCPIEPKIIVARQRKLVLIFLSVQARKECFFLRNEFLVEAF